ncbi:MAG: hypothetical protein A3I83_05525 [Methylotenera sp. RIFCSPLOWO2_02_FULL_45_14]|nr:MAG: hypothetical protein A3I83_05525 [Methylotenera sp. RIFCSPLOWO2_02_FULL_45_14]
MSMMTREDMLRELELLPVWQLRAPLPTQIMPPQAEVAQAKQTQVNSDKVEPNPDAEKLQVGATAPIAPPQFMHIASEEGEWLFILPDAPLPADEAQLLQNIFIALRIKVKPAQVSANVSEAVATLQPKRVIAMGEGVGQYLLASDALLKDLRGVIHAWQATQLVVTYDLAHLLKVPTDKADTWRDLCLVLAH